jgi:hypothetical protein
MERILETVMFYIFENILILISITIFLCVYDHANVQKITLIDTDELILV